MTESPVTEAPVTASTSCLAADEPSSTLPVEILKRRLPQVLCAVEDPSLADLLARRMATSESQEGGLVRLKYELGDGSTVVGMESLPPLASRLITAA